MGFGPLNLLKSSVELANLHGIKDPEIKKLMAMIERHAKQLNDITNSLLDSARIQSGKIELKLETINFNDIVVQWVIRINIDVKIVVMKKILTVVMDI